MAREPVVAHPPCSTCGGERLAFKAEDDGRLFSALTTLFGRVYWPWCYVCRLISLGIEVVSPAYWKARREWLLSTPDVPTWEPTKKQLRRMESLRKKRVKEDLKERNRRRREREKREWRRQKRAAKSRRWS